MLDQTKEGRKEYQTQVLQMAFVIVEFNSYF